MAPAEPDSKGTAFHLREVLDKVHCECQRIAPDYKKSNVYFRQVADLPGLNSKKSFFSKDTHRVNQKYLQVVNSLMATVAKQFVLNGPVSSKPSDPFSTALSEPETRPTPQPESMLEPETTSSPEPMPASQPSLESEVQAEPAESTSS